MAAVAALAVSTASAAEKVNESLLQKDFPFQGACISAKFPSKNTAMKGLAIRLPGAPDANILFDTDLCRVAAGWTGGYIDTHGVAWDGAHGGHPAIVGDQKFGTAVAPGVSVTGEFTDSRKEPFGPTDSSVVRWDGLHVAGDRVQLNYTVAGGTKVHEQPSAKNVDGETVFLRTFQLDAPAKGFLFFKSRKTASEFSVLIADSEGAQSRVENGAVVLSGNGASTRIKAAGLPKGASLKVKDGRVTLHVAAGTKAVKPFQIAIWSGADVSASKFETVAAGPVSFADLTKGGPARWPQTVDAKGTVAKGDGSYVVDNITPPIDNPWKRRVRIGGFDFFADGTRAAVCTWDGDIWIVSGIDGDLQNLKWKRFASGMYETLGLKIVNDQIYTSGRDQLTRYYDYNGDGEADYRRSA